jgi:outer membrane biosynthesis protein TonB
MKPGGQRSTEETDEAFPAGKDAAAPAETPAVKPTTAAGSASEQADEQGAIDPAKDSTGAAAEPADVSQRVDWTAILEERALVPDSEEASPVAVPKDTEIGDDDLVPARRRGLLYIVVAVTAAFSVAASVAVVITLLRSGDSDEPAKAGAVEPPPGEKSVAPADAPAPPAPVATPPAASAPAASPPAAPTPPTEPPPAAPAAEPGDKDDPDRDADRSKRASKRDRDSDKRSAAKSDKDEKRDAAKSDRDETEGAAGAAPADAEPAGQAGDRSEKPSAKDLAKAIESVKPAIEACAKQNGVSGTAAIKLEVQPDGKIAWAAVREGGEAFQSCVGRALRSIRLPASEKGGTLVHSVKLPDP